MKEKYVAARRSHNKRLKSSSCTLTKSSNIRGLNVIGSYTTNTESGNFAELIRVKSKRKIKMVGKDTGSPLLRRESKVN